MDAFDQYFRTLGLLLPRAQRDDIIRELSEEMRSQIATLEAERDRSLTADEQAELLRQLGHPLVTAARYRPQRSLIGPLVFPYYKLLLQLVLTFVVIGHVIAAVVFAASGRPLADVGSLAEDLVANVLKIVGWLTALAALGDGWLTRSRVLDNWRPSPTLVHAERMGRGIQGPLIPAPGVPGKKPDSLTGFIVSVTVSAWWLAGLKLPWLFFGPGSALVEWGPAMHRVYPVLVIAQAAMLAEYASRLLHRDSDHSLHALRAIWLLGGALLAYLVFTSNHAWMVWREAADATGGTDRFVTIAGRRLPLLEFVNYIVSSIFVAVVAASIVGPTLRLVRRLLRHGRAAAAA